MKKQYLLTSRSIESQDFQKPKLIFSKVISANRGEWMMVHLYLVWGGQWRPKDPFWVFWDFFVDAHIVLKIMLMKMKIMRENLFLQISNKFWKDCDPIWVKHYVVKAMMMMMMTKMMTIIMVENWNGQNPIMCCFPFLEKAALALRDCILNP